MVGSSPTLDGITASDLERALAEYLKCVGYRDMQKVTDQIKASKAKLTSALKADPIIEPIDRNAWACL